MCTQALRSSAESCQASIFKVLTAWADGRSKDPNTKVGACVYDNRTGAMHIGYNGFPRGILDLETRWGSPEKNSFVIHAEENAILKALPAVGSDLSNCQLYSTLEPCHKCMRIIIQSGLRRVTFLTDRPDHLAHLMAREANITVEKYAVPRIPAQ